jgi:biopolymer transport protein ExbB
MKLRNLLLLFFFTACGLIQAQSAGQTPDPDTAVAAPEPTVVEEITGQLNLQQIMESGGFILYILAAMSVVAVALVLLFLISLNKKRIAPTGLVTTLQAHLEKGELTEARAACEARPSPVSALALSALDYLDRAGNEADPELLRQVVEGEGVRQVGRLQSQITFLMDIGVIAPMVGLLGTVMGMLKSFSGVALNLAQARPQVLADGVSQALVTTAAGLFVAIPAMMFYSLFRGRLSKLTANLELVAADIVTTLAHRKSE